MIIKPQISTLPGVHILFSRPLVERQSLTASENQKQIIGFSAYFRDTRTVFRITRCQGISKDTE